MDETRRFMDETRNFDLNVIGSRKAMSGGSAEIAFWTATRHLVRKAAPHAPDEPTRKAYELVINHAQERVDHYLRIVHGNAARPPTPPEPKSA
jgi:hypothetical protein